MYFRARASSQFFKPYALYFAAFYLPNYQQHRTSFKLHSIFCFARSIGVRLWPVVYSDSRAIRCQCRKNRPLPSASEICDSQILAHAAAHNLSAHPGYPDTYVPDNPRASSRAAAIKTGGSGYREYYRPFRADNGDVSFFVPDIM